MLKLSFIVTCLIFTIRFSNFPKLSKEIFLEIFLFQFSQLRHHYWLLLYIFFSLEVKMIACAVIGKPQHLNSFVLNIFLWFKSAPTFPKALPYNLYIFFTAYPIQIVSKGKRGTGLGALCMRAHCRAQSQPHTLQTIIERSISLQHMTVNWGR